MSDVLLFVGWCLQYVGVLLVVVVVVIVCSSLLVWCCLMCVVRSVMSVVVC